MNTLQNKFLQIKLNTLGAELTSILANGKEYLWQADPSVWKGQSPILFPIIGFLKDGSYLHNGKKYSIEKHGFFRKNEHTQLVEKTDSKITFSLKSNSETLQKFPFEFDFKTSYELQENKIIVSHEVLNLGENTLYFSIGEHPAFNCSLLKKDSSHSDCYLEFETEEHLIAELIDENGLVLEDPIELSKSSKILNLPKTIFDKDALIFKNLKSEKVSLINASEGKLVSIHYNNYPYLAIWAKPNAPYVCIEPWFGVNDYWNSNQQIENKEGIFFLKKKGFFTCPYFFEIHF